MMDIHMYIIENNIKYTEMKESKKIERDIEKKQERNMQVFK